MVGAILFGAFSVLVMHFDVLVVGLLNGTLARGDVRRVIDLGEAFGFGPTAIVIALGVFIADQRTKWFTARLFAYPIIAGLVANGTKLCLPRLRPRALADLEIFQGAAPTGWDTFAVFFSLPGLAAVGDGSASVWQSFPSGHSATAMGLAIGLSRLYPQARWYFLALAAFTGLQRVVSSAHYPSDVLAGAAVAMICCWLIERKSLLSLAITRVPKPAVDLSFGEVQCAA
jgi:membrane-associated phospholipid phosphatase